MAGINKVIIIGHLGADPDLRSTSGGTTVCRLSVATTRTWTNKQTNEKQQETEWHRVTVWGTQATNCEKYLSKGRQVYIEGRLRTSSYDKDGRKHWSTEVVAEVVQFLGGKDDGPRDSTRGGGGDEYGNGGGGDRTSRSEKGDQNESNYENGPNDNFDDDIPF